MKQIDLKYLTSQLFKYLFLISVIYTHTTIAQTCKSGSAVNDTFFIKSAAGGIRPAKTVGPIENITTALDTSNSALVNGANNTLYMDFQKLVSGGSQVHLRVRSGAPGLKIITIAHSLDNVNFTVFAVNGIYAVTGVATNNVTLNVPTNGLRYIRITVVAGSTLVDGARATYYCNNADLKLTSISSGLAPYTQIENYFDVKVSNEGTDTAKNVGIKINRPSGAIFNSYNATNGTFDTSTNIWTINTLIASNRDSIRIFYTVSSNNTFVFRSEIVANSVGDPDSDIGASFAADDFSDGIADDDESSFSIVSTSACLKSEPVKQDYYINSSTGNVISGLSNSLGTTLPIGTALNSSNSTILKGSRDTLVISFNKEIAKGASLSVLYASENTSNSSIFYTTNNTTWTVLSANTMASTNNISKQIIYTIPVNNIKKFRIIPNSDTLLLDGAYLNYYCPNADLSLTQSINNSTIIYGDTVVVQYKIKNAGPVSIDSLLMKYINTNISKELTYSSSKGTADTLLNCWKIYNLSINDSAILTIKYLANSVGSISFNSEISNSSLDDPDSNPSTSFAIDDLNDNIEDDDEEMRSVIVLSPCNFTLNTQNKPGFATSSPFNNGVSNPTNAIGSLVSQGTTLNNSNSAQLDAITDTLILSMNEILARGLFTLSLSQNSSGQVRIFSSTTLNRNSFQFIGTWGLSSSTLGAGPTSNSAYHVNITNSNITKHIMFVITQGSIRVDGLAYQKVCQNTDLSLSSSSPTIAYSSKLLAYDYRVVLYNNSTDTAKNVEVKFNLPFGVKVISTNQGSAYDTIATTWTRTILNPLDSAVIVLNVFSIEASSGSNARFQAQIISQLGIDQDSDFGTGYLADDYLDGLSDDDETITITYIKSEPFLCNSRRTTFYMPMPENEAMTAFDDLNGGSNSDPVTSSVTLTVNQDCIVYYDHWEDGFEANIQNPIQSTTEIWGDGNPLNGFAPGYPNDFYFTQGQIIDLQTVVNSGYTGGTFNPNNATADDTLRSRIDYDGKDKLFAPCELSGTKRLWANQGPVSAMSYQILDTSKFGLNYRLPVGENTTNASSGMNNIYLSILASRNATTVNIDADNNGTYETTQVLNEGETFFLDGSSRNINQGGRIDANNPISVNLFGADPGKSFEGHALHLYPTNLWGNEYYSPIDDPSSASVNARYVFFNPNNSSITVNVRSNAGSLTNITIPANQSSTWDANTNNFGYRFTSTLNFSAILLYDINSSAYDWATNLPPNALTSPILSVGYADGATPGQVDYGIKNWSPVFVMATAPTFVYVDLNQDGTPDNVSFNDDIDTLDLVNGLSENTSKRGIFLNAYQVVRIGSTDGSLSGARIYSRNNANNLGAFGANLVGVWGQYTYGGSSGVARLDMGNGVQNLKVELSFDLEYTNPICSNTKDTLHIKNITGVAPFTFSIKKNEITIDTFVANTNSTYVIIQGNGNYKIQMYDDDCNKATNNFVVSESPFGCYLIEGAVYNDGSGILDNKLSGKGMGTVSTNQLWAYLVSKTGQIIDSSRLSTNGKYSLDPGVSNDSFQVYLSTNQYIIGTSPTIILNLPSSFNMVGEQYGNGIAIDSGFTSNTDGVIWVKRKTLGISKVDFAINQRPNAIDTFTAEIINPGFTNLVTVPKLRATDREDKNISSGAKLVISSLPTNATLYYNWSPVSVNQIINNYNPALLQVDPLFPGMDTVRFQFSFFDSANFEDLSPALVEMPFSTLSLSGNVFNDANGLVNGVIDGTNINIVSAFQLKVYLIDSLNQIVDSAHVLPNGKYTLRNLYANSKYLTLISTEELSGVYAWQDPLLPFEWRITNESYGLGNNVSNGYDLISNGIVSVRTNIVNITNLDFGLNRIPQSYDSTAAISVNQGTGYLASVPTLTGLDDEDGVINANDNFVITKLANNGNIYYNNVLVSINDTIWNYNSSLLKVETMFEGAGSVIFEYVAIDNARMGDESAAIITIPFSGLQITGLVLNDFNGLQDSLVNGTGINKLQSTPVYVYLVNAANRIVDSAHVRPNGFYQFDNVNGSKSYNVLLCQSNYSIGNTISLIPGNSDVPTTWSFTGEVLGTNNSAGSGVSTTFKDGITPVTTQLSNIVNVDFALDKAPVSDNKTFYINPDSIVGQTGMPHFIKFVNLNAQLGSVAGNFSSMSSNIMPGNVSGSDFEEGAYEGFLNNTYPNIVFNSLPDTTKGLLAYRKNGNLLLLRNNPSNSNPSFQFWDATNNRYRIDSFNADSLTILLPFSYQADVFFTYSFVDKAEVLGSSAMYRVLFSAPLPSYLANFKATLGSESNSAKLSWKAFNTSEIDKFEIYYWNAKYNKTKIATIKSSTASAYTLAKAMADNDVVNYYEVVAISANGHVLDREITSYKSVHVASEFKLYPNPTVELKVFIEVPTEEEINLKYLFINAKGQLVLKGNMKNYKGQVLEIELDEINPGYYQVVIETPLFRKSVPLVVGN